MGGKGREGEKREKGLEGMEKEEKRGRGGGRVEGTGTTQTQCAAKRPYKCSIPIPPLLLQNMCTIHSR